MYRQIYRVYGVVLCLLKFFFITQHYELKEEKNIIYETFIQEIE